MKRYQTFHEVLIPLLVEGIGAESYLELGTHMNETIGKVRCQKRYGVDVMPVPCPGAQMYQMTTQEFIREHAPLLAPFDCVFVDACHSATAVMDDISGIWPYVAPEGLVLAHDVNPETVADTDPGFCGDAWRTARALLELHEGVVLPYHPGVLILRKRETWGPR